jgi:hypothetical protein
MRSISVWLTIVMAVIAAGLVAGEFTGPARVRRVVGGFLYNLLTDDGFDTGFNIGSLIVAVLGAIIVSWIFSMLTGRRTV